MFVAWHWSIWFVHWIALVSESMKNMCVHVNAPQSRPHHVLGGWWPSKKQSQRARLQAVRQIRCSYTTQFNCLTVAAHRQTRSGASDTLGTEVLLCQHVQSFQGCSREGAGILHRCAPGSVWSSGDRAVGFWYSSSGTRRGLLT